MNRLAWLMSAVMILSSSQAWAWDLQSINVDKAISGGKKVVKAAAGMSDEDEIAIGQSVAKEMAAKFGLVEDPAKLAYVNQVGQDVAKKSSRTNIAYHFAILNSADINAFAAPGGFIFVTQGLLDFVKDEAELAGVLGHEVAHVTQRHVVKSIQKSNLLAAGADFGAAIREVPDLQARVSKYTMDLLMKGLSRGDELEADHVGTVISSKTGYTPIAMREAIARLGEMEGKSSVVQRLNRTHPPAKDRVAAIEKAIEKEKLSKTGKREKQRFESNLRPA